MTAQIVFHLSRNPVQVTAGGWRAELRMALKRSVSGQLWERLAEQDAD